MKVDVAIVGASPAGLRAAWAAASEGARVALLEARATLGVPEPPAAVAFDFLWRASFRPPPFSVRRRLDGVRLRSPGGHEVAVDAPLAILRRARLDPWLANVATAAGARVLTGVRDLRVVDRDRLAHAAGEVRAKVVLFCDGADSAARRFFEPLERRERVTWGAALDVRAPGSERATELTIGVGARLPGGRSQLNPLDDGRWSHWTFYQGGAGEAEARAREALRHDALAMGWAEEVAAKAEFLGAAPDPVYAVPRQLVDDGVMVAGGAGGQGGLEVGLVSGEMAGRAAARSALSGRTSRADLLAYEDAWMRTYAGGYRALAAATERLAQLDDARLDRLVGAWGGRRIRVHDLSGLLHPSLARRVGAVARAVAANPGGAAVAAIQVLRR